MGWPGGRQPVAGIICLHLSPNYQHKNRHNFKICKVCKNSWVLFFSSPFSSVSFSPSQVLVLYCLRDTLSTLSNGNCPYQRWLSSSMSDWLFQIFYIFWDMFAAGAAPLACKKAKGQSVGLQRFQRAHAVDSVNPTPSPVSGIARLYLYRGHLCCPYWPLLNDLSGFLIHVHWAPRSQGLSLWCWLAGLCKSLKHVLFFSFWFLTPIWMCCAHMAFLKTCCRTKCNHSSKFLLIDIL